MTGRMGTIAGLSPIGTVVTTDTTGTTGTTAGFAVRGTAVRCSGGRGFWRGTLEV